MPAVLAYYAVFFGFGLLYFDVKDRDASVGHAFWWMLAVAVLVLFPLVDTAVGPESNSRLQVRSKVLVRELLRSSNLRLVSDPVCHVINHIVERLSQSFI